MAGSISLHRQEEERLTAGRGGCSVILKKTSLRPGAEHSLPVFSSCVQFLAVEPTKRAFASQYKSTQMFTVIDSLRDRLSPEGIWRSH